MCVTFSLITLLAPSLKINDSSQKTLSEKKVETEIIQLTFSQAGLQHVLRKKYKQEV
jgi:hypothetical protein